MKLLIDVYNTKNSCVSCDYEKGSFGNYCSLFNCEIDEKYTRCDLCIISEKLAEGLKSHIAKPFKLNGKRKTEELWLDELSKDDIMTAIRNINKRIGDLEAKVGKSKTEVGE